MSRVSQATSLPWQEGKRIQVLLPDDGSDLRLMRALHEKPGVNAVDSVAVRGISVLREATIKTGQLPEPESARLVTVIASGVEVDALFEFIYETAQIDRPGGGWVMQAALKGCTQYALPAAMPDEPR